MHYGLLEVTRVLTLALLMLEDILCDVGISNSLTAPLIDEGLLKVGEGRVHHGFLECTDNRVEMSILRRACMVFYVGRSASDRAGKRGRKGRAGVPTCTYSVQTM